MRKHYGANWERIDGFWFLGMLAKRHIKCSCHLNEVSINSRKRLIPVSTTLVPWHCRRGLRALAIKNSILVMLSTAYWQSYRRVLTID
ncbi:hypothetical protein EMPG_17477 [Blastomyces silverae]|uniref:Uncharacterized protein n=1 Tax=Blastomyces silverae TaxID=2060906 RepID=A0A0H1B6G7_9EURO|nr:hypothetical protein EMPG_17477 [Blastomyces silverae]